MIPIFTFVPFGRDIKVSTPHHHHSRAIYTAIYTALYFCHFQYHYHGNENEIVPTTEKH